VILAAVGVLVLALSVPAIGSNTHWFGLAKQAKKKAKRANKRSKKAKKQARTARKSASKANAKANEAKQQASQTDQALNSTKVVSDKEAATVTTSSESYVSRGGPTVTVTVPKSGLIEVWAQFNTNDADGGAVSLYEDGEQVPGQADCDPDVHNSLVLVEGGGSDPGNPVTASTPAAVDVALGCVTFGAPGPELFHRPPGEHTYELRYADPCPCVGSVFSNRLLRVAPRL
jgi:hypothetical protein